VSVHHIPCLLTEVLKVMDPGPGQTFVDCTLGRNAGHSREIARYLGPNGFLMGMDLDEQAIASASEILSLVGTPFALYHGNFADLGSFLAKSNIERVDGVLADLGFSSEQMADEARGLSFTSSEKPDMRLDPSNACPTAWDLLQTLEEKELADLFWTYGEERLSRRIAHAIVKRREQGTLNTCEDLARLVEGIYPKGPHRIHPSTRVFMALRISVNRELENLERFLPEAFGVVRVGGTLAVITYHSKEASLVKRFLRRFAGECLCPPKLPVCGCGARKEGKIVTGSKAISATPEEIGNNPRARSAQLRVIQRIQERSDKGVVSVRSR